MTTSPQKSQCQQIWRLGGPGKGTLLQLLAFLASNCYLERKGPRPLQIQRTKRAEFADGSKRLGVRGPSVQKAARKHLCIQFPLSGILHTISLVRHSAGWPAPEGDLGFLWHQQLAGLCRRWESVIIQGRVRGAQEASCWLWTCKDWCHLVLAAASHDPRELLRSLLVSQLFGAPLNKH